MLAEKEFTLYNEEREEGADVVADPKNSSVSFAYSPHPLSVLRIAVSFLKYFCL
jgi:hypothetical protein